jgi:hypothetical protein
MKHLNDFLDGSGFNTRIQPDTEPEPLTVVDRLAAMEKELGIKPPEPPTPEPIPVKIRERGRVEHENLVITGEPA